MRAVLFLVLVVFGCSSASSRETAPAAPEPTAVQEDTAEAMARMRRRIEREAPAYCGELKRESTRLHCLADYAMRESGPLVATYRELMKHDVLAATRFWVENKSKIEMTFSAMNLRLEACWAAVSEAPDEAERRRREQFCIDIITEMTRTTLGQ